GLAMEADVVEGFSFDKGLISTFFATDPVRQEAVYEKPMILVTDKKVTSVSELVPLLEKMAAAGIKDLVLIADEVDGEALSVLVLNKLKGVFNTLALKAPAFGDRRKEILEDIAAVTGATLVSSERGMKLDEVGLEVLGSARKVVATKDETTIIEGGGKAVDVKKRIEVVRAQKEQADSEYERGQFDERVASLLGKVAVIKVGGATETEIAEKKFRVDDAVAATKAALAEGIVAGGGVTLVNLANELDHYNQAGRMILKNALLAPFVQITDNAGLNSQALLAEVGKAKAGHGVNVMDPDAGIIDLKKAGVVDPVKVTKEAVLNSVSIAATAITMGALVVDIPEKAAPAMPDMGGMGGMY
ncbi:chaperonin GroEL, partial [Candidatus Saccharibacteria bacterium]|nr:chaperonin GroEL [Candidatus Saccharibacteria bacterium]